MALLKGNHPKWIQKALIQVSEITIMIYPDDKDLTWLLVWKNAYFPFCWEYQSQQTYIFHRGWNHQAVSCSTLESWFIWGKSSQIGPTFQSGMNVWPGHGHLGNGRWVAQHFGWVEHDIIWYYLPSWFTTKNTHWDIMMQNIWWNTHARDIVTHDPLVN